MPSVFVAMPGSVPPSAWLLPLPGLLAAALPLLTVPLADCCCAAPLLLRCRVLLAEAALGFVVLCGDGFTDSWLLPTAATMARCGHHML